MAAEPTLEYYIGRMGYDPERAKLNKILKNADLRLNTLTSEIQNIVFQAGGGQLVTSVNGQTGDVVIPAGLSSISTDDSVTGDGTPGNPVTLVNDQASPGNNMVYGTDGAGTKGWKADPAGGGGQVDSVVAGNGIDVDATDPVNPIVSLEDTTVVPNTYGASPTLTASFTVDQKGRITAASSALIAIDASQIVTNILSVARGGTGIGSYTAGNYINALNSSTLQQRTPAQVRTDISAVPTTRTITAGTGLTGGGDLSADRTINLADTFVTPGSYGSVANSVVITVDQQGRILTIFDSPININANQITSGALSPNFGGTGHNAVTNNAILVGNGFGTWTQTQPDVLLQLLDNYAATWTSTQTFQNAIFKTGVISISIAANQNNWAPAGFASCNIVRVGPSAAGLSITGIAGGTAGRFFTLLNVNTTNAVTLSHENASSTAANRILGISSGNFTLNPNQGIDLWYDGVSSRWRIIG